MSPCLQAAHPDAMLTIRLSGAPGQHLLLGGPPKIFRKLRARERKSEGTWLTLSPADWANLRDVPGAGSERGLLAESQTGQVSLASQHSTTEVRAGIEQNPRLFLAAAPSGNVGLEAPEMLGLACCSRAKPPA